MSARPGPAWGRPLDGQVRKESQRVTGSREPNHGLACCRNIKTAKSEPTKTWPPEDGHEHPTIERPQCRPSRLFHEAHSTVARGCPFRHRHVPGLSCLGR